MKYSMNNSEHNWRWWAFLILGILAAGFAGYYVFRYVAKQAREVIVTQAKEGITEIRKEAVEQAKEGIGEVKKDVMPEVIKGKALQGIGDLIGNLR